MTKPKPFKIIYTQDPKNERIHQFWQAPNSSPIYQGFFINEEHSKKNINSYLNYEKIILVQHIIEKYYVDRQFSDCETLTFTYPDVECNLEDFEMHMVSFKQGVISGGITKHLLGESPFKLEDYHYITYGPVKGRF